jgi:hypothetical protein
MRLKFDFRQVYAVTLRASICEELTGESAFQRLWRQTYGVKNGKVMVPITAESVVDVVLSINCPFRTADGLNDDYPNQISGGFTR